MKKILLVFLTACCQYLYAQDTTKAISSTELYELSLDELLNVKVSVASKKEMSLRESPGIISVITDEDIKNLGARDLIDVFRLVPGFDFASDIQNYVGLGVRGIWASEGKASVFWDGIEMNDLLYGTVPFGGHFSVDNIKKIEIIRGPGSALYGGTSELAVINITSKKSEQKGGQINATYGQMGKDFGRSQMSATFGQEFGNLKTYFGAYAAETRRSVGIQSDFYDSTRNYNMKNNSELRNFVFNGGIDYKNLSFNFIIDKYTTLNREFQYDKQAIPNYYDTYAANLKYAFDLGEKIKIVPTYQFRYNKPWADLDTITDGTYYNRYVIRNLFKLEFVLDPFKNFNIITGGQAYNDHGVAIEYSQMPLKTATFGPDTTKSIQYNNYSGFVQGIYQSKIGNFTLGARYDKHSQGFDAFVPRIGYTLAFNKIHFKLLAAQAFRTPYIANFTSKNIKPEKTNTFEAEVGFRILKNLSLTCNGFYTYVDDILIYYYTTALENGYKNGTRTGTTGIEAELKYKLKKHYFMVNYSFYKPLDESKALEFQVNRNLFKDPSKANPSNSALAFAPQKINLLANINLTNWLDWNVSANIYSKRYSYKSFDNDSLNSYLNEFPSVALLNTFVSFKNLPIKGLEVGIGCNDILDEKPAFLTPYTTPDETNTAGGTPISYAKAPLPGASREFIIRVTGTF